MFWLKDTKTFRIRLLLTNSNKTRRISILNVGKENSNAGFCLDKEAIWTTHVKCGKPLGRCYLLIDRIHKSLIHIFTAQENIQKYTKNYVEFYILMGLNILCFKHIKFSKENSLCFDLYILQFFGYKASFSAEWFFFLSWSNLPKCSSCFHFYRQT